MKIEKPYISQTVYKNKLWKNIYLSIKSESM